MSARERIIARYAHIRENLTRIVGDLAGVTRDVEESSEVESARGHYGISTSYAEVATGLADIGGRLTGAVDGLQGIIATLEGIANTPTTSPPTQPHQPRPGFAEPGEPTVYDPTFRYRRHIEAIRRFG